MLSIQNDKLILRTLINELTIMNIMTIMNKEMIDNGIQPIGQTHSRVGRVFTLWELLIGKRRVSEVLPALRKVAHREGLVLSRSADFKRAALLLSAELQAQHWKSVKSL